MLTLGIETSGRPGSVALLNGDSLVDEFELHPQNRHAQALVSEIRRIVVKNDFSVSDLEVVAVSVGPGSFTGIRVGVVCAKILGYTLGCHLKGVDTFDAIASNTPLKVDPKQLDVVNNLKHLFVVADAQRGGLFVSKYDSQDGQWIIRDQCTVIERSALIQTLTEEDCVSGPALERYQAGFETSLAAVVSPEYWHPRASHIAELAMKSSSAYVQDPFSLKPCYIRPSAAEEKRINEAAT